MPPVTPTASTWSMVEPAAIDTFNLNGRTGLAETFRIYARAEAILAGIAVSGANTEIVITRTVGLTTTIIAELDNIEEITVNTLNTTANNGNNPNHAGWRHKQW